MPLNLGSGGPLEGFYAAGYPFQGIQKAGASEFSGMLGDAIVTSENGSAADPVWNVHWNGLSYVVTQIGNLSGQAEDGIFVTQAITRRHARTRHPRLLARARLAGLRPRGRR